MIKRSLALLFFIALPLLAQDVILLKNGGNRVGEIDSVDETTLKLRVPLQVPATSANSATPASAIVNIPRADIEAIEFKADPNQENHLLTATPQRTWEIEEDWKRIEQWLSVPRSPAGSIGCKLGELLVESKDPEKAATALELFTRIEKNSWSEQDKTRAKQGRLRAMVGIGRVAEAIAEAKQLAADTENPEILIEANYIMAQAAEVDFNAFLKENPRWEQDPFVIDKRHELYNRVLELYLYPSLFYGSDNARSARGLWGAVTVYQTTGELPLAIETARDITILYPETSEAKRAEAFLDSLKPEDLESDFEAQAREKLKETGKSSPAPTPETVPTPSTPPKPSKSNKPSNPKKT
jgi:hypothetical protein